MATSTTSITLMAMVTRRTRQVSLVVPTRSSTWGGVAWVLGGFVGTSHTNMDLKFGSSATVDSLNAGVYGSTFDVESGVFVNVMAKINQFDNKAKVTMSDGTRAKGDYKALGASGSVAVGKHIRLKDDYFVEPQVQVPPV